MEYAKPLNAEDPNASYWDATAGKDGAYVPAKAIEPPMREILNVITAAGLTPSGDDLTQLLQAIQTMSSSPHELCEFYFFRHPTLRPGFQPAQGGLLVNAATLYPEAWAYLQTAEGQLLCKTEAEWQAMTTAIWATLADGTTVGWNGIGGAPFYAPNLATGELRLPDLRGMYMEAAGYDGLDVGTAHGDVIRDITGSGSIPFGTLTGTKQAWTNLKGAITHVTSSTTGKMNAAGNATSTTGPDGIAIVSSRVVPTGNANKPRAFGVLPCVYLGVPK